MKRPKNRRQVERRAGALGRQAERAKRSTVEQLMFLDDRPGEARRERERLAELADATSRLLTEVNAARDKR